jgi:hypothetical protein
MHRRRQLALFLSRPAAAPLEAARRLLDPVQAELIRAHVTLCREDELGDFAAPALRARLAANRVAPLSLRFGPAQRFQGHGILLPCVAGEAAFHALRLALLGPGTPGRHEPHITLAHPRNPRSAENRDARLSLLPSDVSFSFASVCLIEQEGSGPWRVLDEAPIPPA